MSTVKLILGVLALVALIFGVNEAKDRWDERHRTEADRQGEIATQLEAIVAPIDARVDELIEAVTRDRISDSVRITRALDLAAGDRRRRDTVYKAVKDTAALRIIRQKDTIIDTLTVALDSSRARGGRLQFALDTTLLSRGYWIGIARARELEVASLRKVTPSWWKERIKPRVLACGAAVYSQGQIRAGPGICAGFQIFP